MRTTRHSVAAIVGAIVLATGLGIGSAAASPAPPLAVEAPPQNEKADFIFFPSTVFVDPAVKAAYFDYLKRFDVCLTNGYNVFEGSELAELQQAGCELFVYRWFNGYYESELDPAGYAGQFPQVQDVFLEINSHPEWLLNPGDPQSGVGAVYPAYFYDWMNPDLREFFIDALVERLDESGYNGVFFDYIGGWALPTQIVDLWNTKYPGTSYDEAAAVFLAELRDAFGPDRRIFGNQAYRLPNAHDIYESIDYDVTESYGTTFIWGAETDIYVEGAGMTHIFETFYRPWDGEAGYEAYIQWPAGVTAGQPVEFFEINYVQARYLPTGDTAVVDGVEVPVFRATPDRPAIYYGYALSSLMGISPFASDWYAAASGKDDIYFTDLGEPLEESYRELDDAVVRYFENGFVVVTRGTDAVTVEPDTTMIPEDVVLWDSYANAALAGEPGDAITISPEPYPATGNSYPSGRVYLYADEPVCDTVITGTHPGALIVDEGTTCLTDATVTGSVSVHPGAALTLLNSTVKGSFAAAGSTSVQIADSTIWGSLAISATRGAVTIDGSQLRGSTALTGNIGGVTLSGTEIRGSLQCSGNSPAPTVGSAPMDVRGSATGQCAGW
jgi:hypothetical protein